MQDTQFSMKKKIKVLIVDDSAVVRQALKEILSSDSAIEVIGAARDPFIASDIMKKIVPDVITLDIEMPRMDGITFLQKIMRQHPIPVVICSGFSANNSETALKALEYGAVEIIQKPRLGIKQYLEESKIIICDTIKAAYQSSIPGIQKKTLKVEPKLTADVVIEKPSLRATIQTTDKVVVVGASTLVAQKLLDCFLHHYRLIHRVWSSFNICRNISPRLLPGDLMKYALFWLKKLKTMITLCGGRCLLLRGTNIHY